MGRIVAKHTRIVVTDQKQITINNLDNVGVWNKIVGGNPGRLFLLAGAQLNQALLRWLFAFPFDRHRDAG